MRIFNIIHILLFILVMLMYQCIQTGSRVYSVKDSKPMISKPVTRASASTPSDPEKSQELSAVNPQNEQPTN